LSHSTRESVTREDWLSHPRLELYMIVNMACGTDPLDSSIKVGLRLRLLRYLKAHMDGETPELRAIKRGNRAWMHSVVAVEDFVPFADRHRDARDVGALLTDIAAEWSSRSGVPPPRRRTRTTQVEKAAAVAGRRSKVLEKARKYWPDAKTRPSVHAMAARLADSSERLGYATETIRKILSEKSW